jgi:hypothetical protein
MDASLSHEPSPADGALKGLAWLAGALATAAAAAVGAILAVMIAAALLALATVGAAFLGLDGLALSARRKRDDQDTDVIEARHVGGHSWVAYGWDQQGR